MANLHSTNDRSSSSSSNDKPEGGTGLAEYPPSEILAAAAVLEADAVLVCAGAGMSIHDEETADATQGNVYVDRQHFAQRYPGMEKYGYGTSYECMRLAADPRVPREVKEGLLYMHMRNMAEVIPPTPGYAEVLRLCERVQAKNDKHAAAAAADNDESGKGRRVTSASTSASASEPAFWVWTSNVDGCFERAGFPGSRIYTPQGDMKWMQCREPSCSADSSWPAKPALDELLPFVDRGTCWLRSDKLDAPCLRCPECGSANTFANLRGGDWFSHHAALEGASKRLEDWLGGLAAAGKRLVVLEVGCGMNTPTVTRLPMEAVARALPGAVLVRMNPTDATVGPSLPFPRGMSLAGGWRCVQQLNALLDLCEAGGGVRGGVGEGIGGDGGDPREVLRAALLAAATATRSEDDASAATSVQHRTGAITASTTASATGAALAAEASAAHDALNLSGERARQWRGLSARYQKNPWQAYLAQLRQ